VNQREQISLSSAASVLDSPAVAHEEDSLGYGGWRIILAAFVGVGVSFAPMVPFTFSLFVVPFQSAFGRNREAISDAFAIAALTRLFTGHLLDRLPARLSHLPCCLSPQAERRPWLLRPHRELEASVRF
jgi:Zn-dependent protease with chaperone function